MKNYKELETWRGAMTLVDMTYRLARELPDEERYGLRSQVQRCATSIPTNVRKDRRAGP